MHLLDPRPLGVTVAVQSLVLVLSRQPPRQPQTDLGHLEVRLIFEFDKSESVLVPSPQHAVPVDTEDASVCPDGSVLMFSRLLSPLPGRAVTAFRVFEEPASFVQVDAVVSASTVDETDAGGWCMYLSNIYR